MFEVPKFIDLKIGSDRELLLYFETGMIKSIDISRYNQEHSNRAHPDISLSPAGILLDGNPISNCNLWSLGKFCGCDKKHCMK
jgi:hypothetical protein